MVTFILKLMFIDHLFILSKIKYDVLLNCILLLFMEFRHNYSSEEMRLEIYENKVYI
jgi:hypothetical protein